MHNKAPASTMLSALSAELFCMDVYHSATPPPPPFPVYLCIVAYHSASLPPGVFNAFFMTLPLSGDVDGSAAAMHGGECASVV